MRKGLLTELIEAFAQAKRGDGPLTDAEVDDLRDEVIGLLREGDRLKRRAERGGVPPSSDRRPPVDPDAPDRLSPIG